MGPHDGFFKRLLQHVENAEAVLRWVLPAALSDRLDWATLTFEPSASTQGRSRHSDLVVAVHTLAGDALQISFLFEHQRKAEPAMPLRVAEYLVHGWLRLVQAKKPVVRIVPIVLFNGDRPWPYATSVEGMMPDDGLAHVVGDLQVRGRFVLVDLTRVPDEEICAAALGAHARLGLLLLKNAPTLPADVFWAHFRDWARWLAEIVELTDGSSRLAALLDYIGKVVGTPSRDDLDIITAELTEPATEGVVTWAESLRQEGMERGLQTGLRTGLEKILALRFGSVPDRLAARIEAASVEQLTAWMERAMEAESVEAVFRSA